MQDKTGLISVIVPIYNAETYLEKCLDSIIQQTYTNLEIILVNDGSCDRSKEICDCYAENDARIQVIHKENHGVSAARNDGIRKSKGDYFAFIDADDYILPDYFAYLHGLIKKYDADMACCNFYKMWDSETIPIFDNCEREILFSREEALEGFFYNKNITGHPFLKLSKKSAVSQLNFPEKMCYSEDTFFVFQLLQKCNRVIYGTKVLYIYVQNTASATHNFDLEKMSVSWRMIQNELLGEMTKHYGLLLAAHSRLFVLAVMFCSAIEKKDSQSELRIELLGTIKQYGKWVAVDKCCKKIIRLMAVIGRISPRLLIRISQFNILVRRKFRIAIRQSI